jgi:AsmA-like C-terminal region
VGRLVLPVMVISPTPQPTVLEENALRRNRFNLPTGRNRLRNWLLLGAVALLAILVSGLVLLMQNWPFTRAQVEKDLGDATFTTVTIESFQQTYFPRPGCIATGVTFRRNQDRRDPPLITVQKLTIQGSFLGLLTKHLSAIRADGAHLVIPPFATGEARLLNISRLKAVVGELVANGAVLEFTFRDLGKPRLKFDVHEFVLHDLGSNGAMSFQTAVSNPEPPGEVRATGRLGPWRADDPAQTQIVGSYSFRQANLGVFRGIGGILSSDGKFQGMLEHLGVEGSTDIPDFEVTSSAHKVRLSTQFRAFVNATNGGVELREVSAHFGNTTIVSEGSIAAQPGQTGKTASLDMVVKDGRIQDLLLLFVKAQRSPLTGIVSLSANAAIPPEQKPFLQKVKVEADFGIDSGHFTSPNTQQTVDKLSQQAQGEKNEDPESVLSDLKGHVVLKDGIANFSSLSFEVPGAIAQMDGTYDLVSERIDLRGILHIQAKLSDATTGIKSFLIKALNPFLKNDHPGAEVPVRITGTYSHPVYRVSSGSKP